MANYKIVSYTTNQDTIDQVQAAFEAKLETPLDSTNNVVKLYKILPLADGSFTGVLLYTEP